MWPVAFVVGLIETIGYMIWYRSYLGSWIVIVAPILWPMLSLRTILILYVSVIADDDGWQFVTVGGLLGAIVGTLSEVPFLLGDYGNVRYFLFAWTFAGAQMVAALIYLQKRSKTVNPSLIRDADTEPLLADQRDSLGVSMMARARANIPSIFLAVAVAAGGYWLVAYRSTEFRGAGPMRDTGFFSYYRYHAPLGEFPFRSEGTYQMRFGGLPNERMVLQFYVPGYSSKNLSEIESLKTVLIVEITDQLGNVVCAASGSPAAPVLARWSLSASPSAPIPARWTLRSSPSEAAYWHHACADRKFDRRKEYLLRVRVQNPDPRAPNVQLRAMLEGGGHELP